MVRQQQHCNGFTLIELMLATSLLMMVLFSGYYAYSLYTQKWQKRVDTFWQGTQDAIGIETLNKLLVATIPYVVKGRNDRLNVYFVGDSQFIQFVSSYSLFNDDASLVRIEYLSESKQLVYQEKSLENFALLSTSQFEQQGSDMLDTWEHSAVLLNNVAEAEFSYFGWVNFADAMEEMNLGENLSRSNAKPQWYATHQVETQRILPKSINVSLNLINGPSNFAVTLPNNTEYWLLSNIRKDAE